MHDVPTYEGSGRHLSYAVVRAHHFSSHLTKDGRQRPVVWERFPARESCFDINIQLFRVLLADSVNRLGTITSVPIRLRFSHS